MDSSAAPRVEAVQAQLNRILNSREFIHSERLRRFLRYCVEEATNGRPENLREYTIGMEVFDRGNSYDPAGDPIVRVEARRLRSKLKQYYETEGRQDPLIIDVPKGSYLPSFQSRQTIESVPRPRRRLLAIAVVAVAVLILAVWWLAWREPPAPKLTLARVTSDAGLTTDAAISPDGALVAYASDRGGTGDLDIWIQQASGGEPRRLTREPEDDHEPSFSADGAMIAFRSERSPAVPALGGDARLVARDGQDPRYSPDGKWIAYWVGSRGDDFLPPAGKMYVMAASGGAPKQLCTDFSSASYPVWSSDGKHLLFEGSRDSAAQVNRDFDWWTLAVDGGQATRTGAFAVLARNNLRLLPRSHAAAWVRNRVLFAGRSGDTTSLWELAIGGKTPRRLTLGSGQESGPSVAATGAIAFSSLSSSVNVWSLRLDANRGVMASFTERVTEAAAKTVFPSVSDDGGKVAYISDKGRGNGIWVNDLRAAKELALGHANARYPRISHDGSKIAFVEGQGLFTMASAGGEAINVCGDCVRVWDWSPDGNRILYVAQGSPSGVGELSIARGERRVVLNHAQYDLANAAFSPDGKWLSFHAIRGPTQRQIFIARYPPDSEWIAVTNGGGLDRNAVWSPDGNLLYFLSERDGFRCIWAQPLDPRSKKPSGAALAAAHFHSARRSLFELGDVGAIGLSVLPNKLMFSLGEVTGNVWIGRGEGKL